MSGPRILIVDDNKGIHDDLRLVLGARRPRTSKRLQELEAKLLGGQTRDEADASTGILAQADQNTPRYQIDSAYQGKDAISMVHAAETNGQQYDLIFVDMRMPPGIDGLKTIQEIWKINPEIEIAICSAYSDYDFDELVAHLGSKHNLLIIIKPFDPLSVKQIALSQTQKAENRRRIERHHAQLEELIEDRTQELRHSMGILDNIFDATGEAIIALDESGLVLRYNALSESLFKPESDAGDTTFEGKTLADLIQPVSGGYKKIIHAHEQLLRDPTFVTSGVLKFNNGQIYEYHAASQQKQEPNIGQVWCFRNVTNLKKKEAIIQHQAYHDVLTDLPNRLLLSDRIAKAKRQSDDNCDMFAILFIDLDSFKKVNDLAGHKIGDDLLIAAARRINNCISYKDTLARIGGDEFIVLLKGLRTYTAASEKANTIISRMEKDFVLDGKQFHISCSIGISFYPKDARDPEELIRKSDLAMFDAKAKGKGKYNFFSPPLEQLAQFHYQVESELHSAIDNNHLELHYQPVLDANSLEITKIEALVRWRTEKGDLIYPDRFITIAEKSDLINRIGAWVVEKVCAQLQEWEQQGLYGFRVAINFSPKQFGKRNVMQKLLDALEKYGISGSRIEIEITETALITQVEAVREMLNLLKRHQITISIDDFGTGYSSMRYLQSLPIDNIKIDRDFVMRMDDNEEDYSIVSAVISLAHNLNLSVVTEGVENERVVDLLRDLGGDYLQGFYLFRPMDAYATTKVLHEYLSVQTQPKNA